MANQSAKKIFQSNKRILRNLWILVVVVHLLGLGFGVALPMLRGQPFEFRWGAAVAHALNSGAMLMMVKLITTIAEPRYDPTTGELKDGAADLSMPGALSSYYFDIVYMCSFALVMTSALGPKWWLTHVLTGAAALYLLYSNLIAPALAQRSAMQEASEDGKKSASSSGPGRNREERRRLAREKEHKKNY